MDAKQTALITGASSGIGLELAKIFAKNKYNLVLVARGEEALKKAKDAIQKQHRVNVKILAKDLTAATSREEIFNQLMNENIFIDVLVNNAGYATYGPFASAEIKDVLGIVDLSVSAITHLTRLFIPAMLSKKNGKVLNIASTAAFQPGPLMSVYAAAESYILNFSQGLNNELKGSGVNVTCVCLGPTQTSNSPKLAGVNNTKLVRILKRTSAEQAANFAYKSLMQNKAVAIPGFLNNFLIFLTCLGPRSLVTKISGWLLRE